MDEDVEGVEDSTIDRDGEIAITAFNLKDEEEDGHFGKDGSFVWKKKGRISSEQFLACKSFGYKNHFLRLSTV